MLVGRPGMSPLMVGREVEIARLARLVDSAHATAVALVGGEAGVGKTRLVRELLRIAPDDAVVLAGQADMGSLGRPFELFLDALDRASTDERVALLGERDRPIDDRLRIGLDIVRDLAARGPVVVVFDDLHWADAESVQLFERLAEPDAGPRLVIGTYRPDALTRRHPAAELLPRLERRHAVTHLRLERLTLAEVSAFLTAVYGRAPSYRVTEAIHGRTGGNPFFIEELLAAADESDPEQLVDQPLPWSLGELVRSQLEDLSHQERAVIETAAVLGRRVGFDLLSAVSGFGEDELIPLLRTLVAKGLLVETEADVFSFRHALAREAIEADLLGRERRRLHQAALDALCEAGDDDLAKIAHHAYGAGRLDEMVDAARAGSMRYLDSGSTYQALQLAELGLTEACDDDELLKVAGRAAWLAGLLSDALGHANRRLAAARARNDAEAESASLRLICRLHFDLGDSAALEQSIALLSDLVERLDPVAERAMADTTLAEMAMLRSDLEATRAHAAAAIELADRLGLPELRVRAQAELGSALINAPGYVEEGAALLRQATDEGEALEQWVSVARGLSNLLGSDYYRPEPDEARALLQRMREATEQSGFHLFAGSYWSGLADLAEWEGDLGAALANIEEAVRLQGSRLASEKVSWYQAHHAGLALEAGEIDRAERVRDEVDPELGRQALWWTGLDLHIAARRGDVDAARGRMAVFADVVRRRGGADSQQVYDIVRALASSGVPAAEVAQLVESIPVGLFRTSDADLDAYHLLVRAHVAEAGGDDEAALLAYERAIATEKGELRPAALGSAHVGAGRLLVAAGRLDDAKACADEASRLLARWGGSRVEELHALERRLGGGEVVEGPAELTPREREVVALLAEGLTNGEVAGRLFISPKTASVHVSNILAKLGMASRAEVAAYAVRSGLADG